METALDDIHSQFGESYHFKIVMVVCMVITAFTDKVPFGTTCYALLLKKRNIKSDQQTGIYGSGNWWNYHRTGNILLQPIWNKKSRSRLSRLRKLLTPIIQIMNKLIPALGFITLISCGKQENKTSVITTEKQSILFRTPQLPKSPFIKLTEKQSYWATI